MNEYLAVDQSDSLSGSVEVSGAKNAVLVSMASLLLTDGISTLYNVPNSHDVQQMIVVLQSLGANITFDPVLHILIVDTSAITRWIVGPDLMKKMRASILVMGPLLARFGRADIAVPGGCAIGKRPIDLHVNNFKLMGVECTYDGDLLHAQVNTLKPQRIVLEYPSIGATENLMMAACLTSGLTEIHNAALEPEVESAILLLQKMGAHIEILAPATLRITGVSTLSPVHHEIIPDRLEVGALLMAGAITGGTVHIPNARADHLDVVLLKLREMGHEITVGRNMCGVTIHATRLPRAVSFKTGPYPNFPTDLQAPMMTLQAVAHGESFIDETVFENRFMHVRELKKMGADITIMGSKAHIRGVETLYGSQVNASDIRASCALVLAGLKAQRSTVMTGIHHWLRGYEALEKKLSHLGASITLRQEQLIAVAESRTSQQNVFGD